MKTVITALIVSVFLASCKKSDTAKLQRKELMLSAVEKQQAIAGNSFTFDLFKAVAASEPETKNLFISPLSAQIVLGMTSNGSNGETLQAMRSTLGFSEMTETAMNDYFRKLLTDLPLLDPKTTLNIANSVWYRNEFDVLPEFKKINSEYYTASVEALDFNNPQARETINSWVKDKTKNKIPSIIDKPIPGDAVMYLINAIYFKGQWKYQFDKGKTKKMPFYTNENNSVQTDFMTANAAVRTSENEYGRFLELPYGDGKFSMVMLMPAEGQTFEAVQDVLNTEEWNRSMEGMKEITADVVIPKFKFDYEKTLNKELSQLGMGIAFSHQADFTRINPGGGLQISTVKQKAFVEVNEEGTEAAAATSVEMVLTSMPQPPKITINRPFFFAIKENSTGMLLFAGRIQNPA